MARSTASIAQQITTNLQTNYGQVGQVFYYYFNDHNGNPITPSKTSAIGLIIQVVSQAQNLLEQIMDTFTSEIETIISTAVPETAPWIQAQVLKFQYGNAIQVNPDFTIGYPDPQQPLIITSSAVAVSGSGVISVKVAKGGGVPVPLTGGEQTALAAYLNYILAPGQNAQIISTLADSLVNQGTVFYNGQFNATIVANVIAKINAYCVSLPFNGVVKVDDIRTAIKSVPGVVDWVPLNISATPNGGSAVFLVQAGTETVSSRTYQSYAGYLTNGDPTGAQLTFTIAQQ